MAAFKYAANVGFLIYLADSFGYLASVGILLTKSILKLELNWLQFYTSLVLYTSVGGSLFLLFSIFYFSRKCKVMVEKVS